MVYLDHRAWYCELRDFALFPTYLTSNDNIIPFLGLQIPANYFWELGERREVKDKIKGKKRTICVAVMASIG